MPEDALEEGQLVEVGDTLPVAGFALAQSDCDIFKLLYEFRFLRREHLSMLTGRSPKRMHARLITLVGRKFLTVIRLPQQKHIYALSKRALPALVEQGIGSPELLSERIRTHELKEFFLKHEMMLVDLHVMLALAARDPANHLRLIQWREGRELYDSVTLADRSSLIKLPVRPDAFFTLEDVRRPPGANRRSFFLEADRSTESQTRFTDKIRAYWQYIEQGLHTKRYGVTSVRIITITLTEERAQNLCNLTASLLLEPARRYYFFASLKSVSLERPANIFSNIYMSAKSGGSHIRTPLIPPPD